jgi:hypothetical protein
VGNDKWTIIPCSTVVSNMHIVDPKLTMSHKGIKLTKHGTFSVSIEIRLQAGCPGFNSQQGNDGIFLSATMSRSALGPIQPPIQCVPGALIVGVKQPGVKLTTHLHLPPRSKICGAIPPLLNTFPWWG